MSTPLRGAVVGAGYFSQFHLDAWARIAEVEITACCDLDQSKATAAAEQYGLPHVYSDFNQMLDEQQLDFVDIITRPDTHAELCRSAADRGVTIICQKPLAPTVDEARSIVKHAHETQTRFMVHENFRFQPWYREIKRQLQQQTIGSKLHTITFRNRAGDGWGNDAYLARQPYFQEMKQFLIFEAGIHTIDTFRYLGGEIERVWCLTRRLNPVIAGEDSALAVFQFETNGLGVYDANRYNESTADDPRYTFGELTVEADQGTLRLYDDGRLTIQRLGQAECPVEYTRSEHGFGGDCVYTIQQHFVECLRSGQPFETEGKNYLRSIAVQEAAYRSASSGNWESPSYRD